MKPNLSVTETFGFIREKVYSTIGSAVHPAQFASACQYPYSGGSPAACTINTIRFDDLPGHTVLD